jgi:hypothetical protein
MFNRVRAAYQEQISRAFKQAPWRRQTQSIAVLAVVLLLMAILGGFYLTVAARAGTAGRDLQGGEQRKAELIRSNDELRAALAELRSVKRLAERARALGYEPVAPEAIDYLAVKNYPPAAPVAAPPALPEVAAPATLGEWLNQTLQPLLLNSGGG